MAPSRWCDVTPGAGKALEEEDSPNMASSNILSFEWHMSPKRSSTSFSVVDATENAGEGFALLDRGCIMGGFPGEGLALLDTS